MKLARQIRFYGGVFFLPCLTDFPSPGTPVSIYALNKELIFCYADLTERSFRVTRIRSWRITTLVQVRFLLHLSGSIKVVNRHATRSKIRCLWYISIFRNNILTDPNWNSPLNTFYPKTDFNGSLWIARKSFFSLYVSKVW